MNEFETELARHTEVAEREARKASTKPATQPTPSIPQCESELLAAGWKPVHAHPFWSDPDGVNYACASFAWEQMKHQEETKANELPSFRFFIKEIDCWYTAKPEKP